MISTKGRYALKIMIDLSQNASDQLVSLKDISSRQNVSMKYLEMIVRILHKGDMVISGRGKKGGYRLARAPEEYTVGEILKSVEKSLAPVTCIEDGKVVCDNADCCISFPMWRKLDEMIDQYLEGITLKDVVEGRV